MSVVRRPGGLLELALRGDENTAATVLSAAIRGGVKLSSFAPAASDLEELFLQITNAPTSEVQPISTAQMLKMREDRNDRVGRPTHYALTAGALELFPTPDATYTSSLVYFGRVTPLSDSNAMEMRMPHKSTTFCTSSPITCT